MVTAPPQVPDDRVLCAYHRRSNKYAAERNVRCVAVNDAGARCKKTVRLAAATPDEAALCNVHRPAQRCTGRTLEGKRCRRKVLAASDAPGAQARCAIHRKERRTVPPAHVKCVATRANGRRCKRWALQELVDDARPLCAYHAGRGIAQRLPPDHRRCTARNRWGERCGGWRFKDGLCNGHAGLTPINKGNELGWKHGYYARPTPAEALARQIFAIARAECHGGVLPRGSKDWWLLMATCRVMLDMLMGNWNAGVVDKGWGVLLRHADLIFKGAHLVGRMIEKGVNEPHEDEDWLEKWLKELPDEFWEEVERMEA